MDAHVLTIDDVEFDKIINNARYQNTWWSTPIGYKVENASTNPAVKRIDRNGEEFNPDPSFFWNHELFIMPKVLLSPSGTVTYGPDRKGTGLDLTGASGDVMVWCNNAQYKSWYESDSDTLFKLFAPYYSNYQGFDYHPHCYSGGGVKHDHFFLAAYEAYGYLDPIDSKYKLGSATGKQPITGGVAYQDCPNTGRFTIDDALLFAANKGAGWTIEDIYCGSLMQDLFYAQHGTRDSQTAIGLGVVNLPTGNLFAGKSTGADGIDTNVNEFGTGSGTGTNGLTPTSWDGLQNYLGGNVCEFTTGINFFTDGTYRVTKRDGTGTIAGTLPAGSYENGVGTVPLVDAYYSKVMTDPLGSLLNIPAVAGDVNSGSSKAYCGQWYYPRNSPSIMFSGGGWTGGLSAGVGCRAAIYAPSYSYRSVGARLKYIPQQG